MRTFKRLFTVVFLAQLPASLLSESFELRIITPEWDNKQEIVLSTGLRVPNGERSYVTGFDVFLGQEHIHHAILYGFEDLSYTSREENEEYSAENQTLRSSQFWTTADLSSSPRREFFLDSTFIKNIGNGIGLEVGSRSRLRHFKLTLHASLNGQMAQVGFKMSMETEVDFIGGALTFNPTDFSIPPGHKGTTKCASQLSFAGTARLVGYHIHSHHLGQLVYLNKLSGGQQQTIIQDKPNGHRTYGMLPPAKRVAVADGDILEYICDLMNSANQTAKYGQAFPDDTCVGVFYYALANQEPLDLVSRSHCLND